MNYEPRTSHDVMAVSMRRSKGLWHVVFNYSIRKNVLGKSTHGQAIACIFTKFYRHYLISFLNRPFRNADSKQRVWRFFLFTVSRFSFFCSFIEFRSSSLATFRWRLVNITGLRPCTKKAPEETLSLLGTLWSVLMPLRSFLKNPS